MGLRDGPSGPLIPPEKALGSFRPPTRSKPRSPAGAASGACRFLNIPARGNKPARSAMPGPLRDTKPESPAPLSEPPAPIRSIEAAPRRRYHLTKTRATRSRAASPATPPTIPPASTDAGGVLLVPLPPSKAALLVLEGLDDVAEAPPAAVLYTTDVTVPGLTCEAPELAEASKPEDSEGVADDPSVIDEPLPVDDPSVGDDASEEMVVETGTKLP